MEPQSLRSSTGTAKISLLVILLTDNGIDIHQLAKSKEQVPSPTPHTPDVQPSPRLTDASFTPPSTPTTFLGIDDDKRKKEMAKFPKLETFTPPSTPTLNDDEKRKREALKLQKLQMASMKKVQQKY